MIGADRLHFGAALRLLRVSAGLSLRELAQRIGVSSAYLSRVENGHDAAPTPDRLVAIAAALDLPAAVLVELARQAGPAVAGYLERTPEAGTLFLEIARRDLKGPDIARVKAFIDAEMPATEARGATPRLADLLLPSRVVVGLSCADWEDLVSVAAARLSPDLDARAVAKRALAREREASSALGGGLAAPHAIMDGARHVAVLVTLARPLRAATPDGAPIRVAVLVVSAERDKTHLATLARIARLATYDVADELCHAGTPERARTIVERVESLW